MFFQSGSKSLNAGPISCGRLASTFMCVRLFFQESLFIHIVWPLQGISSSSSSKTQMIIPMSAIHIVEKANEYHIYMHALLQNRTNLRKLGYRLQNSWVFGLSCGIVSLQHLSNKRPLIVKEWISIIATILFDGHRDNHSSFPS